MLAEKKILFYVLLISNATVDARLRRIKSNAELGERCEFPDGVKGRCDKISLCRRNNGLYNRNDTMVICGTLSNTFNVCCRNPTEVVEKMCDVWRPYWKYRDSRTEFCIKFTHLIKGGEKADTGEFPHMASVGQERNDEIAWQCGGTLITPSFVMTAAHCLTSGKLFVGLGQHNRKKHDTRKLNIMRYHIPEGMTGLEDMATMIRANNNVSDTYQVIEVENWYIHPHYDTMYHDIALLQLKTPAMLTRRVLPACLSTKVAGYEQEFEASGWGAITSGRSQVSVLRKVTVRYINPRDCMHKFRTKFPLTAPPLGITRDIFCSGGNGTDTCKGDSGGPLMELLETPCHPRKIAGIVSKGPPCNELTLYTKVSEYLDWITAIVAPGIVDQNNDNNDI